MKNCKNPTDNIDHSNIFKKAGAKWEKRVDDLFEKIEKKFDAKIKGSFVENFTVPKEVREVAEMVNAYRAESFEVAKSANRLSETLASLSDEDSIALTRALGGDAEIPTHLKELHERFRKVIDRNAQQLVENGALAEESVIKDYLKRYYKGYLEEKHGFSIKLAKAFKRKDLTHEERLELGMVENADFVIANTILEQNVQLKKAKLLKRIADEFGVDEKLDGYVKVSDETVASGIYAYGALAGKYVPARVHTELTQARLIKDVYSLLDRSVWTKTIDHIKVNVTVKNPGTHIYNIASNIQVAYLNGDLGSLVKISKMMVTQPKKFKKLVKMARKFGLNNEIEDYETFKVGVDVKKEKNIFKSVMKNLYMAEGTRLGEGVRRVYGWEDEIFKLAAFYKRIEGQKMNTKTAQYHFKEAMADYVDYSTPLPPIVRRLDRNGVFPFAHYVWKSTSRVAKMIAKNPLKYALLQYALLESGASLFSDDDNMEKPTWAEDNGFAGVTKYIPSNLFAAKQWVKMEDDEFLNIGRSLPGMRMGGLAFDGGFIGSFLSIMQGKDPLWGTKVYKESDSPLQATFKSLQKFSENYAPPMTFGRYGQRAVKKITGFKPPKNSYGEELSWDEFGNRIVGVRKFNRTKEVAKHYKAVVKSFKEGNIDHDEMDEKLREILTYAEEHEIELDMTKLNRYEKKFGERDEDWKWWWRYFI